jgi:hypothetical protein
LDEGGDGGLAEDADGCAGDEVGVDECGDEGEAETNLEGGGDEWVVWVREGR